MPRMRTRSPLAIAVAAALALSLAAGCSSDEGSGDPAPSLWPLTGEEGYPTGDTRQVVTVKIENTGAGRPQLGIGSADLVVQELVEGGLTRLAVMFHSEYPDQTGPVRSMRETDIGLVLPTGGTLAASGGSGSTVAALDAAGVSTVVEGDTGFYRDSSRSSPYNVMLDVAELGPTLPPSPPPALYLPFGELAEGAAGSPAAAVDLMWPDAESSFAYDSAAQLWTRSDLDDTEGFSFTNVIALTLPVTYSGTDAAGTPIPTMATTGSGQGYVATGGNVYNVRWSKASDSAPWSLTYSAATQDGEASPAETFTVPPGRTWLALLPEEGGGATFSAPEPSTPAP